MRQPVHYHYEQLTTAERNFVDEVFSRDIYDAADAFGIPLAGDDRVERAVNALARAVIESRPKPVARKQNGMWPNWGDSPNGFDGPGGAE